MFDITLCTGIMIMFFCYGFVWKWGVQKTRDHGKKSLYPIFRQAQLSIILYILASPVYLHDIPVVSPSLVVIPLSCWLNALFANTHTHSYHFISCLSLHNVHKCLYICIYIYIHIHIPLYPIIWLYPSTSRCIRYPMISHFTAHYHIVHIKAPWKPHNALPHAGVNMTGPRLKDFHLLSSGQNPAVPASTYALCV